MIAQVTNSNYSNKQLFKNFRINETKNMPLLIKGFCSKYFVKIITCIPLRFKLFILLTADRGNLYTLMKKISGTGFIFIKYNFFKYFCTICI